MRRRKFIALLGGAAAWPLTARAQQAMPVIGFLRSAPLADATHVAIEYRSAENDPDRLSALATDFARRPVRPVATSRDEPRPLSRASKGKTNSDRTPRQAPTSRDLSRPNTLRGSKVRTIFCANKLPSEAATVQRKEHLANFRKSREMLNEICAINAELLRRRESLD
jgi:hypothetical protein